MRVRTTLVGATLGLSLALSAARAQATPILLAEAAGASGIAWSTSAPSPGTVDFSYDIRLGSSFVLGPALLTSSYDAATPVPIVFDLSGAALAATIAALQDGVVHGYDFTSFGPDQFDGSGRIRTTSSVFDTFDFPDLTPYVIGAVQISVFQTCVRGVGETCAVSLFPGSGLPNEISARVRMSVFSTDDEPSTVPEPGTMILFTTGVAGLLVMSQRRQRRPSSLRARSHAPTP